LDQPFLIIAGASKAGTTSVFNYLAGHPQICPSKAKETRFFLDADYPLASERRYEKDGSGAYLSFFDCARDADWRLEATPDYLYSRSTARLIRDTLPNVRLIFILREPRARLISMYRFAQKMEEISPAMTFDEFLEIQFNGYSGGPEGWPRHPVYHALEHGRYSLYLQPFLELFDRSLIHIAFQEDLARNPIGVVTGICRFAEIDDRIFDNASFKIMNKGFKVRSAFLHGKYWRSKEKLRDTFRRARRIRKLLRRIGGWVDAGYRKINVTDLADVSLSPSAHALISTCYRGEAARLREMLGIEIPWPEYPATDAKGLDDSPTADEVALGVTAGKPPR
jgi:hypothetical protein